MKDWINWQQNWPKILNIIKLIKPAKNWFFLGILAVIFFLGASSFNYFTQSDGFIKWSSPDETANYNFAKLFGQERKLSVFESYNLYADDIIHPRSIRSDHGELKPVSFLGIELIYGQIVHWTNFKVLPYLTPLFAAIGLIFYYLLVGRIFGRRNAMLSTVVLTFFPVYIYFSARSMFHNVLFVDLLIVGLYFAVMAGQTKEKNKLKILTIDPHTLDWKKFIYPALAGFFIGLAIITRTSELLWLGPMLFILWLINIRRLGIVKLMIILSFILVGILPALYWNNILYGSPTSGGYPEMNQSLFDIAQTSTSLVKTVINHDGYIVNMFNQLRDNIFHFGFQPRESMRTFVYYFVIMFYWLFWPAVLGLILFFQDWRHWKARHYAYLLSFIIFSLILVFYYGSWEFHDNPDPKSFTIGNSYTRYWLPIYLAAIPLFSLFIIRFSRAIYPFKEEIDLNNLKIATWRDKLLKHGYIGKNVFTSAVRIIIVFVIIILSLQFVAYGSEEGLLYQGYKQIESKFEFDEVMKLAEKNSTIITRYHDKLFFPERKVIVGLFDDQAMVNIYSRLVNYMPVYYYNFNLAKKDLDYLNNGKLLKSDLQIKKVHQVNQDFTLYKLYRYVPLPVLATSTPVLKLK